MMRPSAMFGIVLTSILFANWACAEAAPNDEQARVLATEAVAKATSSPTADLNTRRMETLEDDLFYMQVKVRGRIHKGAYFYRVESGGYQITPDEVTYKPHSAQSWYVAVATDNGETFGLYGFSDADAGFQKLISKVPVEVAGASQAQAFATFYLEAVHEARASIVYDELKLEHNVEEHFVGYTGSREPIATKEARFRQWWRGFVAKKIGSLEPNVKVQGQNGYLVLMRILEMTVGRAPELWEWSLEIRKNGGTRLVSKRPVFPESPRISPSE